MNNIIGQLNMGNIGRNRYVGSAVLLIPTSAVFVGGLRRVVSS